MNRLPPIAMQPITTTAQADAFSRALVAAGLGVHTIRFMEDDERFLSDAECTTLRARMTEVSAIEADPFATLVFLSCAPAALVAVDVAMQRVHGEGLNVQQIDALQDGGDEAVGMLEDMRDRMGLSPEVIGAALAILQRHVVEA